MLISVRLQRQCKPHLTEAVKASVEGICHKIYHLSAEHAKKVKEKHRDLLKEQGIQGKDRKGRPANMHVVGAGDRSSFLIGCDVK